MFFLNLLCYWHHSQPTIVPFWYPSLSSISRCSSTLHLSNPIKFLRLLSNDVDSWGAFAHDYLIPISERVHSFSEKLPEQSTDGCTSTPGWWVNCCVHCVEELVSLVRTRNFQWFSKLSKKQWLLKDVLSILDVIVQPIIQEGDLAFITRAL